MEKSVYINNVETKFVFVPENDERLSDSCGITNKLKNIIYIDENLSDFMVYRTILHELVHAHIWLYGFENIATRKFMEEDVCNFIESFGPQIFSIASEIYNEFIVSKNKEKEGE